MLRGLLASKPSHDVLSLLFHGTGGVSNPSLQCLSCTLRRAYQNIRSTHICFRCHLVLGKTLTAAILDQCATSHNQTKRKPTLALKEYSLNCPETRTGPVAQRKY